MKKTLLTVLALSSFSTFAQDINFGAQERWLAQFGKYTCGGAANTDALKEPTELRNRAVVFTYMTTDFTLDNGKFVASYYEKGTECRYNLVGHADNATMIFTKTDSHAYSINGGAVANCAEGKAYLDSLFAAPNKYFYKHGTMSMQVAVSDAAEVCGEGATNVGIFFKKAAKTKID